MTQIKDDDFGSQILRHGPWVLLHRDGYFFVAVDLPGGRFDVVWEGESIVEAQKVLARQAKKGKENMNHDSRGRLQNLLEDDD